MNSTAPTTGVALVRSMQESDRQWILSAWERYYGHANEAFIDAAVGDNDNVEGFVAEWGNERAGFAIATVADVEWINNHFEIDVEPHVSHTINGVLYQIVVTPEHRGKSIGTVLTQKRLEWLYHHDTELHHVLAVCWAREDGPDARSLLEHTGFESVEDIEREYDPDVPCPDCEEGCDCDHELLVATWDNLINTEAGR